MQTSEATSVDPRQADPRRVRISVPLADISTNAWLDAQDNISRSIQVLIRESIERDGVIDVVNRPVEQLPRRGRPPLTLVEQAEINAIENHSQSLPEAVPQPSEAQPSAVTAAPAVDELEAASDPTEQHESTFERVEETTDVAEAGIPDTKETKKQAPQGMGAFLTS